MTDSGKTSAAKTVRRLVTLPLDVAARVDLYQQSQCVRSGSEALRALIDIGLTMTDTPNDLFDRLQAAAQEGRTLVDVINRLIDGHPLVASTTIDSGSVVIALKIGKPDFVYSRSLREWSRP